MTSIRFIAAFAVGALTAAQASPQARPIELKIDRTIGAASELQLESGQNRLLVLSEEIGRISVADPNVADLKVITPFQVLLTAKTAGSTDLTLWNRTNQPLVIALQVGKSLEGLRKQLKELFPGEQITASAAGELVVLSGQVSDVRMPERIAEVARLHARQVANLVQVTGNQQVQLEVRFAEVSRTGLRDIGVNFFYKAKDGTQLGGITGNGLSPGSFLNTTQNPSVPGAGETTGHIGRGQPPDVYNPQFAQQGFSVFFSNFREFPFSTMLSLLESNGLAKVLAEPTLVTLSGQEAKFLAGGEMPIPLASTFGTIQVEWKKFGILLNFTPTVIGDNTIHLRLATEVSDIDPSLAITIGGSTIPGLTSRQSETTVRLGNGQSFAIAGLMSDRVRSNIDKVPLLGSIPILGALFRSSQFRRLESELLVIVTARLAQPVAPHELPPLPTDFELNDPGNFEFFLLGMDGSANDAVRTASTTGRPAGATGYAR
jgi:pilus assembly protein CpaC